MKPFIRPNGEVQDVDWIKERYGVQEIGGGCWETPTKKVAAGVYNAIKEEIVNTPLRRYLYEITKLKHIQIPLSSNVVVASGCGNIYCVNPEHGELREKRHYHKIKPADIPLEETNKIDLNHFFRLMRISKYFQTHPRTKVNVPEVSKKIGVHEEEITTYLSALQAA